MRELENITFKDITFSPSPKPIYVLEELQEIPKYLYNEAIFQETYSTNFSLAEYTSLKNSLIKELNKIYETLAKKERLEKELAEIKFEKVEEEIEEIAESDIWKAEKLEQERRRYIQECEEIGLEYDEQKIKETLQKLSEQLSTFTKLEKHVGNYTKLLAIEDKMKSFEKGDMEEYEKLSREKALLISELKKGLELLSCPSCNVSLSYKNGTLFLADRAPSSQKEIDKLEKEYKEVLLKIENLKNLEKLKNNAELLRNSVDVDFEDLKNFMKSGNKISTISMFINKISNIKFIKEIDIEKLKNIYNFQKWKKKKKELDSLEYLDISSDIKQKLENLENEYNLEQQKLKAYQDKVKEHQRSENERLGSIRKLESEREKIRQRNENKIKELERFKLTEEQRFEKYRNEKDKIEKDRMRVESEIKILQEKILEVEKEKIELESKLDSVCKQRYENIKKELEDKKEILENSIYGLKMVEKGKELEEKRNSLLDLQKDVQTLNKMKLKAVEVEHRQLEETVNNINTVLQTTLPIFFNEPINLTLLVYKKLKNNVKPCLNLEICYKGCKYDNVNSLSGGEGDRVSLALLLALNFASNSPIILLDECVSSLDGDLKENCITAIKSIPNKTVICIDHDDTIEGYYDSVITV